MVAFVIVLIFVLVLLICGGGPSLLEVPFFILFGWINFIARMLSKMTINWGVVVSVTVYATMAVAGSHLFLSWLHREWFRGAAPPVRRWRFRWTAVGAVLFLLMFAAGTAAIGVTHQTAWLATSPRPLFVAHRASRVKCASNLRQIGQGIMLYANDFGGRFPDDMSKLILYADLNAEVFTCPSSIEDTATGQTIHEVATNSLKREHCSFIYLGKGLTYPADQERIVAYEYDENHEHQGMNILFGDGHVEWFTLEAAKAMIAKQQAQPPATQP